MAVASYPSRPASMARATAVHRKKPMHLCSYCDKQFAKASALKIHTVSHTREKPFVCDVHGCGRAFSILSNLRRHKKQHSRHRHQKLTSSSSSSSSSRAMMMQALSMHAPSTSMAAMALWPPAMVPSLSPASASPSLSACASPPAPMPMPMPMLPPPCDDWDGRPNALEQQHGPATVPPIAFAAVVAQFMHDDDLLLSTSSSMAFSPPASTFLGMPMVPFYPPSDAVALVPAEHTLEVPTRLSLSPTSSWSALGLAQFLFEDVDELLAPPYHVS